MADLGYTFRSKRGALLKIIRPNGGAQATVSLIAPSGTQISFSIDAEEIADLCGGLAIVRDYR